MTTIITSTEDIKAANSAVVHDLEFASISSFVADACSKYLQPAIGKETYVVLVTGGDIKIQDAATLAKKAEANIAIALFTNFGSVKLGETGAMVYQDDNRRIASDKKVNALINQAMGDGSLFIEDLIFFLEGNREIFTSYADSNARKNNRSRFVNSTAEFDNAFFINKNATLFNSLKAYITDAEREHIEPLLGDDFTETLRDKVLDNTCNEKETQLLGMIAKVVAPYAIASAIPYRAVNLDANGLFTNTPIFSAGGGNTDSQQGIDVNRLSLAMGAARSQGSKNLDRLRKFISKNQDLFTGSNIINLNSRSIPRQVDGGIVFL